MNPVLLDPPAQLWQCAYRHCVAAARTVTTRIPLHPCPEMGGLMVPLVRVGERAGHRAIERPDYTNGDLVQDVRDRAGHLVMAVETHRDDGFSTTVYAPTATASVEQVREARSGN